MANALLSTVNAAKQRQPMCFECEKSLPNQIVFDKIEKIIKFMQDEQNGLPVKTAKSFMSKIPSVFTGTDLIQWMMRNLKLEDQQEAMHLANLIASHGYIFPIEDHTLSIKNDCTFYRFQTPCLWPSNNSDPENTDYAVYLCKRTMQGKTRLELADYEAENLARLQKMFSRKWEFIFMQAESQAKVDKKRDKLERKVLDSQERAFWDVYRPVPGCVNTTELDIKKACRLSKSAKRCGECRKVASNLQSSTNSTSIDNNSSGESGGSCSSKVSPTTTISKTRVQVLEDSQVTSKATSTVQQQQQLEGSHHDPPLVPEPSSVKLDIKQDGDKKCVEEIASEFADRSISERLKVDCEKKDVNIKESPEASNSTNSTREEDKLKTTNNEIISDRDTGVESADCCSGKERKTSRTTTIHLAESEKKNNEQVGERTGSLSHQHHRHHHHHHHHHPHPHTHHHGHHRHHHHHHHHHHHLRQCPHHEQQVQSKSADQSSSPSEPLLSITNATSSVCTGTGTESNSIIKQKIPKICQQHSRHERQLCSQKRSVGSVDRLVSLVPAAPGAHARRKSECNPHILFSMLESPTVDQTSTGSMETSERTLNTATSSKTPDSDLSARPSSACCSLPSLEKPTRDRSTSSQQQASCSQPRSSYMQRKSSLNLSNPPSGDKSALVSQKVDGRKVQSTSSSEQQQQQQQQCSPLRLTQSNRLMSTTSASESVQDGYLESSAADRQDIGELERELEALKVRLDGRIGGVKMSKVTQSYLSYFKQWAEYDPFIAQPIPSNPWIGDSTELWDSERQTKDVHCRRVRRWAFSLKELLNDPAGREQFHRFLEKEFSAENLKFWDAVQDLKRVHSRDVGRRVEAIWTEYLAADANCPINIDSKSYETSKKNMAKNKNNRCIFDEAAGHVYQLMKNDSYPRYLRSDMYKDYKEASEKKRNQQTFDVFKPQITTLKHKFNF